MARKRVIPSVKVMAEKWEEFKNACDTKVRVVTSVSKKTGEIVEASMPCPVTYTLKGFCLYVGITEQALNATYWSDPKFFELLSRMKMECEIDAREKFEQGYIDPKLAALWMGHFGYTTKAEAKVDTRLEDEKSKLDDILDQLKKD